LTTLCTSVSQEKAMICLVRRHKAIQSQDLSLKI